MPLKVAMDGSGHHSPEGRVVMAACVATSRQWRLLLEEWREIVEPVTPDGKNYHAKDRRYYDANLDLARLLNKRMDGVLVATVDKTEYHEATDNHFRGQYGGKPDALAAQALLVYVAHQCRERGNRAAYVSEAGDPGEPFLDRIFKASLRQPHRERLRILSHVWVGKDCPIVHAPDLVSHCVRRSQKEMSQAVLATIGHKLGVSHLTRKDIEHVRDEILEAEADLKARGLWKPL